MAAAVHPVDEVLPAPKLITLGLQHVLVMYASAVAATGARILGAVDLRHNRHNLFIVALSIGFGMIPLVAPNFFKQLPHELHPLLESGILLAAIAAVLLSMFFYGVRSGTEARAAAAATTHGAEA